MHVWAQTETNISGMTSIDTSYIENYKKLFAVKNYGINKKHQFSIVDSDSSKMLNYNPNENMNFGFGIAYKWLGLNIAFKLPIQNDDSIYGKTKKIDFQTNIYTRRFVVDLNVQRYN
ncbi:MAG: hypothetical protein C0594_15065, partial [Marinilabiliales bacterium]